jgi:hypothetical protein
VSSTTDPKALDSSTTAALPGGLVVSRGKYAEYFGRNALDRWCYRRCSYLPWGARSLPGVGARIVHWHRIQEQLQYGCLNPAVVVDAERRLIAVYTSLTAWGDQPTPVIKILRERLDLIRHSRVTDGSRLAAASIYWRTDESWARGCWSDFSPVVVDCLVDDQRLCAEAVARLKPLAWQALQIGVRCLCGRYAQGLYAVQVPAETARDAY